MEDKKSMTTTRQGRKKILPLSGLLCIGGEGGIAGLLVFGGALAIAGFMAAASFASNKEKAKGTHGQQTKPKPKPQTLLLDERDCKTEEDHDNTQSLMSLIQNSSIQLGDATRYWKSNMSIDQDDKNEHKPGSADQESPTCFQQEIVFSDSSHPESAASSNGSGVADDQEADQKDEVPQDDLTSSETETETEDDVDEDDDDDDDSELGEEDSSKGTTSLDYKEKQVWPAELIQHAKRKFKGDIHVCSDSDVDRSEYEEEVTVTRQANLNQNLNLFMVPNNQPLTWVFPLLLVGLLMLLVLLTRRPQESFYVLDEGHSVVRRI